MGERRASKSEGADRSCIRAVPVVGDSGTSSPGSLGDGLGVAVEASKQYRKQGQYTVMITEYQCM